MVQCTYTYSFPCRPYALVLHTYVNVQVHTIYTKDLHHLEDDCIRIEQLNQFCKVNPQQNKNQPHEIPAAPHVRTIHMYVHTYRYYILLFSKYILINLPRIEHGGLTGYLYSTLILGYCTHVCTYMHTTYIHANDCTCV